MVLRLWPTNGLQWSGGLSFALWLVAHSSETCSAGYEAPKHDKQKHSLHCGRIWHIKAPAPHRLASTPRSHRWKYCSRCFRHRTRPFLPTTRGSLTHPKPTHTQRQPHPPAKTSCTAPQHATTLLSGKLNPPPTPPTRPSTGPKAHTTVPAIRCGSH